MSVINNITGAALGWAGMPITSPKGNTVQDTRFYISTLLERASRQPSCRSSSARARAAHQWQITRAAKTSVRAAFQDAVIHATALELARARHTGDTHIHCKAIHKLLPTTLQRSALDLMILAALPRTNAWIPAVASHNDEQPTPSTISDGCGRVRLELSDGRRLTISGQAVAHALQCLAYDKWEILDSQDQRHGRHQNQLDFVEAFTNENEWYDIEKAVEEACRLLQWLDESFHFRSHLLAPTPGQNGTDGTPFFSSQLAWHPSYEGPQRARALFLSQPTHNRRGSKTRIRLRSHHVFTGILMATLGG